MTIRKVSLISLLCLCISPSLWALNDDFKQQIVIESDRESLDIARNIAIFYGPVRITQGSILIEAGRLEVSNRGQSGKEVMVATGNPASFSQQLEDGRYVKAQAKEIRFERANNLLLLSQDAQLSQDASVVESGNIRYDMERQVLIAEPGEAKEDKVRTILQPSQKNDRP